MNLRWTQYAVGQFDALVDNLEERRGLEAARAATQRIMERVRSLRELPRSAPAWPPANDESFRRLVIDGFVVLYRVVDSKRVVFVLSIRDGRQRPLEPGEVPRQ